MESIVVLGLVFIVSGSLALLFISRRRRTYLDRRIPAPPSIPLLGNLLQIDLARPHLTMSNWSADYGPIFRVKFGFGKEVVVVSGLETISEALVAKSKELSGRPRSFRANYTSNRFRNIGFGEPTVDRWWKPLRNTVRRELKASNSFGQWKLEKLTREVACELSANIATDGSNGLRPIDIRPHLYSATLNVISTVLAGIRFLKTDIEFDQFTQMERLGVVFVSSAGGSGAELDIFPFLRFFRQGVCKRLEGFDSLRNELFNRLKELAKQNACADPEGLTENPLLSTLMHVAQLDNEFDEEHIKGTFTDLVLGGMSSSTNLIYALVNILMHNKDIYRQLKDELVQFHGTDALPNHRRYPSLADRSALPYTQAIIFELLRYVCIAPFTVPHKAVVDTTLAGYTIPRGTEILPNLWYLHHDPAVWTDPWRFDPSRFLTSDGKSLVAPDHPSRRHLMPFGAGIRRCTGEAFAISRLFLLISHLLTDFDLLPGSEQLVTCDPRTYALGIAVYPMDYAVRMVPTEAFKQLNSCGSPL